MPTAQWKKLFRKIILVLFIAFAIFISSKNIASANTTAYRSANTVTTDGNPQYTNISNCSGTDGNTCDRLQSLSYANLFFRNFGDFNIPDNSTITNVRIRVTGKASIGIYAGVSPADVIPGITFTSNCQSPSDLWRMVSLVSAGISTYTATTPVSNGTLARCFSLENIRTNKFVWRINYAGPQAWSSSIDNFEIAFDYTPPAAPTPTPTPTPVQPFLDLPWDYEAKGQTFADSALSMSSYFDHEYPLLSSGLTEPQNLLDKIKSFDGISYPKQERSYSSHDGYDWAKVAKVNMGDPVLAAAAGTAKYIKSCTPCGNMILIDHENGYQTRYLHMQKDGLIVSTPGANVNVTSRQQIGKVGATGNVSPAGDAGAHIHFGVFEDKNHDGDFNDNVPDGVTDPFGWQSSEPDPWENYSFFYNDLQRTGNKSYYLWKKKLGETSATISPSGGSLNSGHYFMTFPPDAVSQNTTIELAPQPIAAPSSLLSSIGPTLLATAKDQLGNSITNFLNPFTLVVDFADLDLSNFDLSTLSIYSSQDSTMWTKEPTAIDFSNQKASAALSHFTHFALMAERLDSTPPITTAVLSGDRGENNWYRSDVTLSLSAQDDQGGLGVDYTLLDTVGGDWDVYSSPIIATNEGHFKYDSYSVDKAGNIEDKKTIEFDIDKTPPVITSTATVGGDPYTSGSWTNENVLVTFSCTDSFSGVSNFSNPILVSTEGEYQSVLGECKDKAGNTATIQVTGINIDKTPPEISVFADPSILWSPNGKFVPVKISGFTQELNLANKTFTIIDEYGMIMPKINEFGDTIFLQAQRNDNDFDGRKYIINVEAVDLAGNKTMTQAQVIVPHDKNKK